MAWKRLYNGLAMQDDADLLRAVRKLDHDALNEVFERYAVALYKYALRLCGNPAEADDAVGEVFAQLLKHLSEGKGPRENLRSYLYQIAYHKIVDNVRTWKHQTMLTTSLPEEDGDLLQRSSENREQVEVLEHIIKTELTEDQRNIVILRFIEGFSLKEAADITGKDIGNIKVIQNRAIARIRQVLGKGAQETL